MTEKEIQDVYDRVMDTLEAIPDEYEVDSIVWALSFVIANFGHCDEAKDEIKGRIAHLLGPAEQPVIKETSGRIILAH